MDNYNGGVSEEFLIRSSDANKDVLFQHPLMKTTAQLLARYGNPTTDSIGFEHKWMIALHLPEDIHSVIPALPKAPYVNKDVVEPLEKTLRDLIAAGVHKEIKTWDGCFVVRKQRGSSSISMHSFGIAIDLNAQWNPLYGSCSWSETFIDVWRANKWICGADFHTRKDPMHFEFTSNTAW